MKGESDPTAHFPLGAELEFLRRLWRLNRALALVSSRLEKELGITAQQRLMIRCIGRYPGMTAGQLATELYLDRGTVSAALRRLEKRSIVQRHSDHRDKRRVTLGLTARGRALDVPRAWTVESAVAELLNTVDAPSLAKTDEVIGKLTRSLEKAASY